MQKFTIPTQDENRFRPMTPEQRHEHIERAKFELAKSEREKADAAFRAKVEAQTEVALQGNEWLRLQQSGQLKTGQALAPAYAEMAREAAANKTQLGAPQALIDQLPVRVGGVELGPKQAKEMLASGQISKDAYNAGLNAALAPYGYSFR